MHQLVRMCRCATLSVSRRRLDGSRWNSVRRQRTVCLAFHKSLGWGTVARVHVRILFLYLGNSWTDCAENCCVVRDHQFYILHRMEDSFLSARVTVQLQTFKHVYHISLVHRPKGALLVCLSIWWIIGVIFWPNAHFGNILLFTSEILTLILWFFCR